MTYLLLALGAMFVQQTFTTMSKMLVPVIAPAILTDLALDAAWIGVYVSLMAFVSVFIQMSCGSAINRFGAMRMCQVSLAGAAVGLAIVVPAQDAAAALPLFAVSTLMVGVVAAVSTPSSAQLLRRFSPPQYAPLVFSIKQTAVPAGLLLCGLAGPFLAGLWGWRGAVLVIAGACLALALLLQPLRDRFDTDRDPSQRIAIGDFFRTLKLVGAPGAIQPYAIASFAFNGLQSTFIAYFVVFLTIRLDYSLAAAGAVFATAMAVAVPARIVWGWVGSGLVAPPVLLALLGIGMFGGAVLLAMIGPGWSLPAVTAVAVLIAATGMSWQGLLLSESARLAPEGMVGGVTGGVLAFAQLGALTMPAGFSLLLVLTGGYATGFVAVGLPGLLLAVLLWRARAN